jgi:hypothetical protein
MLHDHAAFDELLEARRLKRRALFDLLLVGLASAAAALLAETAWGALEAAMIALSLGLLAFVIRRDRDLTRHARRGRWRERAVEGKGVSMTAWREGARLVPWGERQGGAPRPQ